tara:strand:- start:1379 stop:2584 length:1206 start_codon:yes stop_codon:yes gene_type:complete
MKKKYVTSHLIFLINDIIPLLVALPFTLYIFFLVKIDFNIDINTSYLIILIICNLFIVRKILDIFYNNLMNNNVIQRNIMLVGTVEDIQKILEEKKDKINIYKCCLIKNENSASLERARLLLKIPVFTDETEMRIILEYHELGQIWILDNGEKNRVNYFLDLVIKFSVDIIIINFKVETNNDLNLLTDNLVNNKYTYSNYQTSRFYGFDLFIKILFDKLFSIIFLLILSPVFVLSMVLIFIEDGSPIFSSDESAGWDGRRFNMYKLRTIKKNKSDQKVETIHDDQKLLKIGRIAKKLHIEKIPQFFNVLKGDMSIVGPRAHVFEDDLIYSKLFRKFLIRNKTSPGITGWAQIHGFRGSNPTDELMRKRMEFDLWYMNNWSNWLDIYIILKTFSVIFSKPKT